MNHEIFLWISPRLRRTFKPECVGNVQAVPCRAGPSPGCISNTAKPFAVGELSLLISETGAGKEQEYDLLHRISVCFVYRKYLDKDTAFNWYFPIPRTQIMPIMLLSKLGVCSLQCWGAPGQLGNAEPVSDICDPVLCGEGDGCCV